MPSKRSNIMNSDKEEARRQPGPAWHLFKMRPRDAASLNKDSSKPYLARPPVWTTPENLRKMEKLEELLRRRAVSKDEDSQQCDMCKQHKGSVRPRTTITVALSSVHWQFCDECAATVKGQQEQSTPNKAAASAGPRATLNKVAASAEPRATFSNCDNVALLDHRPRKLRAKTTIVALAAVVVCIAGFNAGSRLKKIAPLLEVRPGIVEPEIRKALRVEPEIRRAMPVEPEIRKAIPVQSADSVAAQGAEFNVRNAAEITWLPENLGARQAVFPSRPRDGNVAEQQHKQEDGWRWEEIQLHKWDHYTTDGKTFLIGVFKERHLGDRKREVDAIAKQIRARFYRMWEHHKLGNVEEVKVVFYK